METKTAIMLFLIGLSASSALAYFSGHASYHCSSLCTSGLTESGGTVSVSVSLNGSALSESDLEVILDSKYTETLETNRSGSLSFSAPLSLGTNSFQFRYGKSVSTAEINYYSSYPYFAYIGIGALAYFMLLSMGDNHGRGRKLRIDGSNLTKGSQNIRNLAGEEDYNAVLKQMNQGRALKSLPLSLSELFDMNRLRFFSGERFSEADFLRLAKKNNAIVDNRFILVRYAKADERILKKLVYEKAILSGSSRVEDLNQIMEKNRISLIKQLSNSKIAGAVSKSEVFYISDIGLGLFGGRARHLLSNNGIGSALALCALLGYAGVAKC
jgi:hypothetical protein